MILKEVGSMKVYLISIVISAIYKLLSQTAYIILDIQHFQVWCLFGNKYTRIKGIPKLTCYPICNVAGIFISILDLRSTSQAGFKHTYGRKQHGPAPMPNRQRMEWKTNEILLVISIKCFVFHRRRLRRCWLLPLVYFFLDKVK